MIHRIAILVVAGALLATSSASAEEELYLSATNKLEYRRLDQEDAREEAFRDRLEISGYQGPFEAWLRFEALQISNATVYDPYGVADDANTGVQKFDEAGISKRLFAVNLDSFRAEVGDVAHTFGRGLMLSVFEDEALNFDTRLEGFRGRYRHDRGTATVLAGSHEDNRFRGVFLEPEVPGPFRAGAAFVEAWGADLDTDILPREQHAGGYAEVQAGPATVYGEYAERRFPGKDGRGVRDTPGHGGFLAAELIWEGATLSLEHRDFFRFDHEYHDPPTTLRQHTWTSLNRVNGQVLADITDEDVVGDLLQASYSYDLFTSFQGSFARLDRGESDDQFTEYYGEAKGTWREKLFATAAAAESELEFGSLFEERITGLGEFTLELNDLNSLTVGVEWSEVQESNRVTQTFEFPVEFRERIGYVSWGRSPWLNLTLAYEDTTEDDPTEDRDSWLTALAEIAVADNHDVQISLGSEKGGWKCTGGVCFFEPEFEGLKVKWVSRF
jgi:hypothetical protein